MKLLIDNQLPVALAAHLRGWGLDCTHVLDLGLAGAGDEEVWGRAIAEGRIVVSKDEDFLALAHRPGDMGRLLWVRLGNCRNAALLAAFDRAREPLLRELQAMARVVELR